VTVVLLGLRFILELALFAVIGVLGFRLSATPLLGWALATGLVVLTVVVWGLFLSPRRRIGLRLPVRVSLELALYAVAALGLAGSGYAPWGWALIGSEAVVIVALWLRGLPPGADATALTAKAPAGSPRRDRPS
jgi:hypothetical protein